MSPSYSLAKIVIWSRIDISKEAAVKRALGSCFATPETLFRTSS